jgi:hypothetical protein
MKFYVAIQNFSTENGNVLMGQLFMAVSEEKLPMPEGEDASFWDMYFMEVMQKNENA